MLKFLALTPENIRMLADRVEAGYLQFSMAVVQDDGTSFNPAGEPSNSSHAIGAIEFTVWDGEEKLHAGAGAGDHTVSQAKYFDKLEDAAEAARQTAIA